MNTKHCGPCGQDKPATAEFFYGNRAKPDGWATECKECCKRAAMKRYNEDPERWNQERQPYWKRRYRTQKAERDAGKAPDCLFDLSDPELAYIVGLIDGEGHLGIPRMKGPGRYRPILVISMNSEPTIAWLARKLDVSYRSLKRRAPQHMTGYSIRVDGMRLVHLCARAIDFFITKREQAQAIVRFGDTYIAQRGGSGKKPGKTNNAHPEVVYEARAELRELVLHLNRPHIYGPLPPSVLAGEAYQRLLASISADSTDGHSQIPRPVDEIGRRNPRRPKTGP